MKTSSSTGSHRTLESPADSTKGGRTSNEQLDLFSGSGIPAVRPIQPEAQRPHPIPTEFDDDALIAAIPKSGITDGLTLAAEAEPNGVLDRDRRKLLSGI